MIVWMINLPVWWTWLRVQDVKLISLLPVLWCKWELQQEKVFFYPLQYLDLHTAHDSPSFISPMAPYNILKSYTPDQYHFEFKQVSCKKIFVFVHKDLCICSQKGLLLQSFSQSLINPVWHQHWHPVPQIVNQTWNWKWTWKNLLYYQCHHN